MVAAGPLERLLAEQRPRVRAAQDFWSLRLSPFRILQLHGFRTDGRLTRLEATLAEVQAGQRSMQTSLNYTKGEMLDFKMQKAKPC